MPNFYNSTNMSLPIPVVGVDPGPDWALNINACLTTLDSHNHTSGSGVQITPSGLNISSDLSFQGNNATNLRSTRYASQTSPLSLTSDLGCIYVAGADLWYNDTGGTQIRLTQGGSIVGTTGSIAGLSTPASATYVAGTPAFVWQSNVNTAAILDSGPVTIRNLTTGSPGVTLNPPVSFGGSYNLYLPAIPGAQKIVTLDATGTMVAQWAPDYNTITVSSNQLIVQGGNIPNSSREHSWELNGSYKNLTYPLTNIDSIFLVPYNIVIISAWIYSGTAGSAGTTEFDLKVATTSGGSFTSILSTTGKITSAAGSVVWTDSNSVVPAQTGITKPVLSTVNITAGSAIRWDLLTAMTGAVDARIKIFYRQA
jgi:hypothetical protein